MFGRTYKGKPPRKLVVSVCRDVSFNRPFLYWGGGGGAVT
jgi:hypothetical protein